MPLLYIERIDKRTQLGIWQFDDRTHIEDVCPPEVYNKIKTMCNNRQKETAAVYALLNEMLGRGGWTIDHEDSGRPILRDSGLEIGISHQQLCKLDNIRIKACGCRHRTCKRQDM